MKLSNPRVFVLASLTVMAAFAPASSASAQQEQEMQPQKEMVSTPMTPAVQPMKPEAIARVGGGAGVQPAVPAPGVTACSLCYTCGGNWPSFSGVIPTRPGAQPYERGPTCSGGLNPAQDENPYLCCR